MLFGFKKSSVPAALLLFVASICGNDAFQIGAAPPFVNNRKVDVNISRCTRQNLSLSYYKVLTRSTTQHVHRINDDGDGTTQRSKLARLNNLGLLRKVARRKVAVGAAFVCTLLRVGTPMPASASAVRVTGRPTEKQVAASAKTQKRLTIVKAAAVVATGVSVKRYFFRNKMDDDDESEASSGLKAGGEAQYREIMGIQPPSDETSAAAVFVSEDDVIDDAEKSNVEAWFKRAVGESGESTTSDAGTEETERGEEFNQTSPVGVVSIDDEKEEELQALAAAKAAEDKRLAEEAWLAKQEILIAKEKKLADEAAAKAEAEAEKIAAVKLLEETEKAAKAALEKEDIMTVPKRRKILAQLEKRTPQEDVELAKYYSEMTEEEKAFYILADLDIVSSNPDPEDPSYDSSSDDEFCPDYL